MLNTLGEHISNLHKSLFQDPCLGHRLKFMAQQGDQVLLTMEANVVEIKSDLLGLRRP